MRTTSIPAWLALLIMAGTAYSSDLSETIMKKYDKIELAHLPTPLEPMKSLSAELGGPILIEIASLTAKALELDVTIRPQDAVGFDDYLGEGYGILNRDIAEAIGMVAREEGILLDPVYTGKAMAGMIDLIEKGYFEKDDVVVFLHTGGTPALFVYKEEILELLGDK